MRVRTKNNHHHKRQRTKPATINGNEGDHTFQPPVKTQTKLNAIDFNFFMDPEMYYPDYDPFEEKEFNPVTNPNIVILLMKHGWAREELALEFNVHPSTITRWAQRYPSFAHALQEGEQLSKAWWMKVGRRNLWNKHFNNTLFMMNMQNRFDWTRGLVQVNQNNNTQNNTQTNIYNDMKGSTFDFKKLETRELEELRDILEKSTNCPPADKQGTGDKET